LGAIKDGLYYLADALLEVLDLTTSRALAAFEALRFRSSERAGSC
jgi:predicted Co/Zn/Cd cation transporter (cation efflux family)